MNFTKVSVLIPTRGRVARLRTLLDSYECTASGAEEASELVFRVDEDDADTQSFLSDKGHSVIVGPRLLGYGSLPEFFNDMCRAATGDVVMCGNDDMVFKTPHWAPLLLAEADRYPDGLFNLGVSTLNESHYPFCIVSRRIADKMGFLWHPRIFWGDIFLRDVMAHFGRCVMVPHVQIEHDWAGYNADRVFHESDKDIIGKDPSYWTGTHARAVAEAIGRLEVFA